MLEALWRLERLEKRVPSGLTKAEAFELLELKELIED